MQIIELFYDKLILNFFRKNLRTRKGDGIRKVKWRQPVYSEVSAERATASIIVLKTVYSSVLKDDTVRFNPLDPHLFEVNVFNSSFIWRHKPFFGVYICPLSGLEHLNAVLFHYFSFSFS